MTIKEPKTDPEAPTPVEGPRIVVTGTGPNLVYRTTVEVGDKAYRATDDRPLALCACGLSSTRPFCDGSHRVIRTVPTPMPPADGEV